MKSTSLNKFKNNFINDEEEKSIEHNCCDDSNSEEAVTIRRLNIEEIQDTSNPNIYEYSEETNSIISISVEKEGNALITISVEDMTHNKEDFEDDNEKNITIQNGILEDNDVKGIKESATLNMIENYILNDTKALQIDLGETSPRTLQEKINSNVDINSEVGYASKHVTEKTGQRNSASTRPSHRKNYSMMIKENTNHDEALDWRGKDRSMSQTVDLQENNGSLLNNIKFLYDTNTNRSRKRVQQMRSMQVSRGSISSFIDVDDHNDIKLNSENENTESTVNQIFNIKSIKPETTNLHIKNKTIDMNNPEFEFEKGSKVTSNINNTNISNNSIASQNNLTKKDQFEDKEDLMISRLNKYNLPCQMATPNNLPKIDSESSLNANGSAVRNLTTLTTNENGPISTKVHTSCNYEDTEVVISDLEGSFDNKEDETNEDYLFSLSASYSQRSFIPITNSLKSRKDLKEENATPSYLLALSQCVSNQADDESGDIKSFADMTRSNYNLMSYENLDSLENAESAKSNQNRFSSERNKNNFNKSMKDVKHIRLPSGKNYFINSVIEEEFSEICSESELSFKKHSYLFTKGKLDGSSEKRFSLHSSREFQVEKNLENLFFNKMKNTHSNSKSEIPSELNNNLKNAADLKINPQIQINESIKAKNEIFNIQIDLKKNFDELKKKVTEEEERSKAKVENKKREMMDLFFNRTKIASPIENINIKLNLKNECSKINSNPEENTKKTLNKIVINLNTIDCSKLTPRSPSPPLKGKKSPSSKCREEYYQDNSDRSKKHKKLVDMMDSLPKISKEDFEMKVFSPCKKELNYQVEPSPVKRNENLEKKSQISQNNQNNSGVCHKTLKEIYKRQREQKSKHSSIFKSEDLRISKSEGISIQMDSNRKLKESNINTFNSINEHFSFININNNINICTPLSLKNDIVEYGTATDRVYDKVNNNQFDFIKNNISTNNELCQASPLSILNHFSNRKSLNFNLNFSNKQENMQGDNVQEGNLQDNNFKRILFQNDCEVDKSENSEGKKNKEEMSVSNEITINIINIKRESIPEKKDLKEIVENVKIDFQNDHEEKKYVMNSKKEQIINQKSDKNDKNIKNINNNILKVSMCDILKRETIVTHKKNVSLNPRVFLNHEYKLNNLLINHKGTNENNKTKSNSIGKNINNNKGESYNSSSSNITNIAMESKNISSYATVNPDPKLQPKNNIMNNYIKNKTRSSSDSSVKFNHINELLTKQHSILQAPNPVLINYNPGTKKLEKKLNLAALNPAFDKNKIEMLSSSNNNRNLSHDIKSKNNLSTNLGNNKKTDIKKLVKGNKNHSMNVNIYSTNNSNIENSYASLGNKSNSGNSSKHSTDKSKNQVGSLKSHAALIPIPKIPNIKKNTSSKIIDLSSANNNFVLNHEDMFKLYDKIKNLNVDKTSASRNDSQSKWK